MVPAFHREHFGHLLRTAMYATSNEHDAQEAVSAVMLNQIKSGRWDHIEDPLPYFRSAVVNEVLSEHRRRKRRPTPVELVSEPSDATAQDSFNMWEDEQRVTELFDSLPPAQREIMRLIYQAFTCQEIADHLGKNEETVRSNLRHARAALQSKVLPQTHGATDVLARPFSSEEEK